MPYLALATDYDGTLATDGQVEEATLRAIDRWQQSGRKLILITGRQLDDLLTIFPEIDRFDLAVAENGAVLYDPRSQAVQLLGDRPPSVFIDRLQAQIQQEAGQLELTGEFSNIVRDRNLALLATGQVIVATWTPYDRLAIDLIEELQLDLQVIRNKGAVMILPTGVDKASGLYAALKMLDLAPEAVIGVGDAENDSAFLELCGYSVAVANALPPVKAHVDWVTEANRGAGVAELIDRFLSNH